MTPTEVTELFTRFSTLMPEPKTELTYRNEYTLLVAIVLSAQATDVGVNKATALLFERVDTAEKMIELGEEGLRHHIRTIGLYNAKAKNVMALSKILVEQHGGQVPENRESLEALPGVGRKTASVWLNCAKGHPTIAVDTHVFRVSNRLGLVKTVNPLATELVLERVVPLKFRLHAHHWLILHGRYTCKARKPMCWKCPVADLCHYQQKSLS